MKRLVAAVALGLLSCCVRADELEEGAFASVTRLWGEWRASGVVRTDYFHSSKALDEATGLWGATAQLKIVPRVADSVDGKLELRATQPDFGDGNDLNLKVLEGYLRMQFESADVVLGRQIIAWGRADGINPTDNVTPRDYTVMLPFEEDQRFGATAARVDTFLTEEYSLTLLAAPFFEPSRIPLPAETEVFDVRPDRSVGNTAVGTRLNKVGEGFDASVSLYRGFSLLPTIRSASTDRLDLHYNRIAALGADLARNFGRFGVRAEAAYVDTADDDGSQPSVKNPYLHWIAGVDRTFGEYLNLNVQLFQRRVRHHRAPDSFADPVARELAVRNALIDGQQDAISNGISMRISDQWWRETLKLELFGVLNLTRDDYFLQPLATYAVNDEWKIAAGAEVYHGAADTQYGALEANAGAFIELRYGF